MRLSSEMGTGTSVRIYLHAQSLALPDGPSVPPERMLANPYAVERLAASVRETIDRGAVTGPAP